MKKSISALVLAGTITLAGAVPAMAAAPQYPGTSQECAVVVSGTVSTGFTFTLSGSAGGGCFVPRAALTITITLNVSPQASGGGLTGGPGAAVPSRVIAPLAPQTLSASADDSGNYSVPVTINEPGEYTLTVSGEGGTYSTVVTVQSASATSVSGGTASGTALANTGADSGLILWTLVGAGALAAGAASVVVVRRRAKTEVAA